MESMNTPKTVPGGLPLGVVLAKTRLIRAVVNEYDDLINKMSVDSAGTGVIAHLCTARREKENKGESKSEEGRTEEDPQSSLPDQSYLIMIFKIMI